MAALLGKDARENAPGRASLPLRGVFSSVNAIIYFLRMVILILQYYSYYNDGCFQIH